MNRRLAIVFLLLIGLAASPSWADVHRVSLPLRDGAVRLEDLQHALTADLHAPKQLTDRLPNLGGSIDLRGINGWLAVRALNAAMGDACQIHVTADAMVITFDPDGLPGSYDEAADAAQRATAAIAPQTFASRQLSWGLLLPRVIDLHKPIVVLIHGLDGNAERCQALRTLLEQQGYQTATFSYPAQEPIARSGDFLAKNLISLHESFPTLKIDLITQSMGGLIARQYVEGPQYAGGVDRLIMIAPPNHGSKWASLDFVLGITDNAVRAATDVNWHAVDFVTDGLCQAGADLHPRSAYLRALNSRPRNPSVRYTIIAGDLPVQNRMADDAFSAAMNAIPKSWSNSSDARMIFAAVKWKADQVFQRRGQSDGPVSLQSARLIGVKDFVELGGDHRALYDSVDGMHPLAWPIIENRLKN